MKKSLVHCRANFLSEIVAREVEEQRVMHMVEWLQGGLQLDVECVSVEGSSLAGAAVTGGRSCEDEELAQEEVNRREAECSVGREVVGRVGGSRWCGREATT